MDGTVIYDDQPQMVEAMQGLLVWDDVLLETVAAGQSSEIIAAAFAAIDREALIEKGTAGDCTHRRGECGECDAHRKAVERVLVAAGIIPEREQEQRPDPDGMPQSERWGH
jgi:hypothetical protein